jgi:hypothetical protein
MAVASLLAPALFTDRYELTMVAAALADGTAQRDCVFEVFARRLPHGRRYGVLAGAFPVRRRRAGGASRSRSHRRTAAGLAGRLPVHR